MKYVKSSNIPLICGAILILAIGLIIGLSINKKEIYTKVDMVASTKGTTSNHEVEVTSGTVEYKEEQVISGNNDSNSSKVIENNKTNTNSGSNSNSNIIQMK